MRAGKGQESGKVARMVLVNPTHTYEDFFSPLAQTLMTENKATTQYSKCHISAQSNPVSKYTAQNTK